MHHPPPWSCEGITTRIATFGWGATFVVAFALLFAGGAGAVTGSETSSSSSSSFRQTVDIPRDNVLAALALGVRGSHAIDHVANIERSGVIDRSFHRDFDLSDDDALLLLALGRDGGFGLRHSGFGDPFFGHGFGHGFGFRDPFLHDRFFFDDDLIGDVGASSRQERSVSQRVDLDEDDVIAALALGRGFVDLEDIADIEWTSRALSESSRDFDIDEDDALLWLALR